LVQKLQRQDTTLANLYGFSDVVQAAKHMKNTHQTIKSLKFEEKGKIKK
jgi:hypothetical protein